MSHSVCHGNMSLLNAIFHFHFSSFELDSRLRVHPQVKSFLGRGGERYPVESGPGLRMVAKQSRANNAEWPLRKIKMKTIRKAEEKNTLDSTILALKRTPIKSQDKVALRASILDLKKIFEEAKALFEETDEKVLNMMNSSPSQGMPTLEEDLAIGSEDDSDLNLAPFKLENRKSWDLDDPTVPLGWKTKICPNGGGKMQKKFLDPFGKVCETRKQALQRMMGNPAVYSEEEIHMMKSHMNNKMEKVFREVEEKKGLDEMQEAVDELKEIEEKVMMMVDDHNVTER